MNLLLTLLSGILFVEEPPTLPVTLPNGSVVQAELARTPTERAMGLMDRKALHPLQGMLFVFDKPDSYFFWMKNTLIPLDIIWLDSERRIIHIEERVPPCRKDPCPSYGSWLKSLYVLEVNQGESQLQGLSIGMELKFTLPD
jgi:uncharacterized protein